MTLEEFLASKTPEFREKVKKEHSQMVLQHAISRLRYEQNLTQEEVARKLQLSQLTDLVRYVNTLGGKLSLQVDLPSGKKISVPLTNFEHSKAFRKS